MSEASPKKEGINPIIAIAIFLTNAAIIGEGLLEYVGKGFLKEPVVLNYFQGMVRAIFELTK